ncbi:MAG: prepilin-type N-terminal cleavage/methylation domain-containing protein [Verrucomicrobiales bacterium]|nr:prepilin-type N-terminal cleavage/methylation domain-containing protein [Verrucomicrobiales bacterium]
MKFPSRQNRGYTLIEVMLAIALLALLVGGVFAVQRGALIVSREVTEQQEISMRQNAFVELIRRNLEQVPGNARLNLLLPRGGDGGSELYLKDYPLAFSWSGVSAGSKSVILRIERNRVGNFTAVVLYLDQDRTEDFENGRLDETATDRNTGLPVVRRLELMDGIRSLIWSFYDDTAQDWAFDWPLENTRRPSLIRMEMELADGSEPLRLIFWVPVMVNPQQFTGGAGGTQPPPGGVPPGGGGPPGGVPPININPGGGPPGSNGNIPGRGGRGDRGGFGPGGGGRSGNQGFGNAPGGGRGGRGGGGGRGR